jgi:hypothetical protein
MTARTATATVTWNSPTDSVWHDDRVIHGKPYPTRNTAPDLEAGACAYLDDLTDEQRDHLRAVHESAHAVSALAAGAHVHYAKISTTTALRSTSDVPDWAPPKAIPGGDTRVCDLTDGLDFITFMGAGERAEDRWLREQGLWTPVRSVGVEIGAYGDRDHVLHLNPHFGFEGGPADYLVVHHFADHAINRHWDAITAVAAALATTLHLTGDQIASLADLPNGTHSATCTFQPTT